MEVVTILITTFAIFVALCVWVFSGQSKWTEGHTETYSSSLRLNRTSSWYVNHALVLYHVANSSQSDSTGTGLWLKFHSEMKISGE